MRADVPPEPYIPLQDAARWYGVDPSTIYRMLRERRLTRHRRGGDRRTYLAVEELERVLRPRPVEG